MIQTMARSRVKRRKVATTTVARTNADAVMRDRIGSSRNPWISPKAPSLAVQCSE